MQMCKRGGGARSNLQNLLRRRLHHLPQPLRKIRITAKPDGLTETMKTFVCLVVLAGLFVSCQKQQSEEERKAEVEREVQQRLAAQQQDAEKQRLEQREADLKDRERAVAEKDRAETPRVRATAAPQRREVPAAAPRGGYSMFYTRLEAYGDWLETSNYGYVWRPHESERSRAWRPYLNGHWVYTDAGWTWVSEEPFGWATYHYGRWARLRDVGWVWVPGDEWAPAWVSWRKSDDYVGWAPLPPEARFERRTGIQNWADNYYDIGPDQYSFVPSPQFGEQRVARAVVPSERNVTIINETTNVTNITYTNTTIVNQGPSYDELRSRSQQPIERLRLERQVNVDMENPHSVVRGEVLEVQAPVIARPERNERPPSVKQTITEAAVDLGWAAIADHQAAQKARAKIHSEATPPPDAPSKTFVKSAAPTETTAAATSTAMPTRQEPIATTTPSVSEAPAATPVHTPQAERSAPGHSIKTPTPIATATATATAAATAGATTPPQFERTPEPTMTRPPSVRSLPTASVKTPQTAPRMKNVESNPRGPGSGQAPSPSATVPPPSTPASSPSPTDNGSPSPFDKRDLKRQKKEEKRERKLEREGGSNANQNESGSPVSSPSASANSPSPTPP